MTRGLGFVRRRQIKVDLSQVASIAANTNFKVWPRAPMFLPVMIHLFGSPKSRIKRGELV